MEYPIDVKDNTKQKKAELTEKEIENAVNDTIKIFRHFLQNKNESESKIESFWKDTKSDSIRKASSSYNTTSESIKRLDDALEVGKAKLLEEQKEELIKELKDNVLCAIMCDYMESIFGVKYDPDDTSLNEVMDAFYKLDPTKMSFSPVCYEKLCEIAKTMFADYLFADTTKCATDVVSTFRRTVEDKVESARNTILNTIFLAFSSAIERPGTVSTTMTMTTTTATATSSSSGDLFGPAMAAELAKRVQSAYIDHKLLTALTRAFTNLKTITSDEVMQGRCTEMIRALTQSIHDQKSKCEDRNGKNKNHYLRLRLPAGTDPRNAAKQLAENLHRTLGVSIRPDAVMETEDGDGVDKVVSLVVALESVEDYARCLLHTTRIGAHEDAAVLERCPTIRVTVTPKSTSSAVKFSSVPIMLENFAKENADLLNISAEGPAFTASFVSIEWANIVAACPDLFFVCPNSSIKRDDFTVEVDPEEDNIYKHNLSVKRALQDPRTIFALDKLRGLTVASTLCIRYAWDGVMWLAYYTAACAANSPAVPGLLALIARTTTQFIIDGHITVVERSPPLDPSIWAVKNPQKALSCPRALASGLLIVATAAGPLPAAAQKPGDIKVTVADDYSPLDAARKAGSNACILINVANKTEQFGKGWEDGTFSREHADEAEVLLGTALALYLTKTFKKELGALTERIGPEEENVGNVALVRDVLVVRQGVATGYAFVGDGATVNIACASVPVGGSGDGIKEAAKTFLTAAAKNNMRTVVVGNLCRSESARRAFVDTAQSMFGGFFDEIVFASNNFVERKGEH